MSTGLKRAAHIRREKFVFALVEAAPNGAAISTSCVGTVCTAYLSFRSFPVGAQCKGVAVNREWHKRPSTNMSSYLAVRYRPPAKAGPASMSVLTYRL